MGLDMHIKTVSHDEYFGKDGYPIKDIIGDQLGHPIINCREYLLSKNDCKAVLNFMINNPGADRHGNKWDYHINGMKKLVSKMNENDKAEFYAWW